MFNAPISLYSLRHNLNISDIPILRLGRGLPLRDIELEQLLPVIQLVHYDHFRMLTFVWLKTEPISMAQIIFCEKPGRG